MKDENPHQDEKIEINLGAGSISFGGLFKGLGNLIDLVARVNEDGVKRSGEIKGLPRGARGVYGFNVRTLAGKTVIDTFGNIKATAGGPVVEEVREPIVDVFDEKESLLVIAEMPGVSEKEIKIDVNGDILNLTASGKDRKYAREVLLPCPVKPQSIKTSFHNGILEIRLEKE